MTYCYAIQIQSTKSWQRESYRNIGGEGDLFCNGESVFLLFLWSTLYSKLLSTASLKLKKNDYSHVHVNNRFSYYENL